MPYYLKKKEKVTVSALKDFQIPAEGRKSKKIRVIVAQWQNCHRSLGQSIYTLKPYFCF